MATLTSKNIYWLNPKATRNQILFYVPGAGSRIDLEYPEDSGVLKVIDNFQKTKGYKATVIVDPYGLNHSSCAL